MVRFSTQSSVASKRLRLTSPSEDLDMAIPSAPPVSGVMNQQSDTATLATLDTDTLDCVVCMEPLSPPIFQCCNGHIACNACRARINDVCPSCSKPLGSIRCLAMEKLMETLSVSCRYANFGCGQMPKFIQKANHERICEHRPCACLVKPCNFSAPVRELSTHLMDSHQVDSYDFPWEVRYTLWLNSGKTHFLLNVEGSQFVLHQVKEQLGMMIYVMYLGSSEECTYMVEVKSGKKRLTFEGVPQSILRGINTVERNTMDYVLVPSHMYPQDGHLQIEISFKRSGSCSAKKKISFSEAIL